jgi:hypothetical protein
MRIALFAIGIVLVSVGIAFIYWPASLICLGSLLAYVAVKMDDPRPTTTTTQQRVN